MDAAVSKEPTSVSSSSAYRFSSLSGLEEKQNWGRFTPRQLGRRASEAEGRPE
jgi:hypothetical protein